MDEIDERLAQFDPGKQKACERLEKVRSYMARHVDKMNYKELCERDLDFFGGAVNYVIARRFDCGGMRWIKERAEHLVQLRCIEMNDDWDVFIKFGSTQICGVKSATATLHENL